MGVRRPLFPLRTTLSCLDCSMVRKVTRRRYLERYRDELQAGTAINCGFRLPKSRPAIGAADFDAMRKVLLKNGCTGACQGCVRAHGKNPQIRLDETNSGGNRVRLGLVAASWLVFGPYRRRTRLWLWNKFLYREMSHTCGNGGDRPCLNPAHIAFESPAANRFRLYCSVRKCRHIKKCTVDGPLSRDSRVRRGCL